MKESTILKILVAVLPFGIPALLTYETVKYMRKKDKEKTEDELSKKADS